MNKEEYKKTLHTHFPEEPENVLEFSWHLHSLEKAKHYIEILSTCNSYSDISEKVIRVMYISGEIDRIKALSEKFIAALLPFTCLEKVGNAHSVTHHIRKMLDDDKVKAERKYALEQLKQKQIDKNHTAEHQICHMTIQIEFTTNNEEFIRQILLMASTNPAINIKVKENKEDKDFYISAIPEVLLVGSSVVNFVKSLSPHSSSDGQCRFCLSSGRKTMPIVILNLCSIFGDKAPTVRYTYFNRFSRQMSMWGAQKRAEIDSRDRYIP